MSQTISEKRENFVNMLTSTHLHLRCAGPDSLLHGLICSHWEHQQGLLEPLSEQIPSVLTFVHH